MTIDEDIALLKEKFPNAILEEKEFLGEISLVIDKSRIVETLRFFKQPSTPGYEKLTDLTAVDYLQPEKSSEVIYFLQNPQNLLRLRLIVNVKRHEKIPSIVSLWRGADWYERELFDLFGIEFQDRTTTERILMPDDWHGHPLRRDYALTEEPVQFKHGVIPKVPSEIIPYVKKYEKS